MKDKSLYRRVICGTFLYVSLVIAPPITSAQSCSDSSFHILDFWIGDWEVFSGDQKMGTNRIEKILGGCAIMENWESSAGNPGKSLFYYYPPEKRWKQIWVTTNPFSLGGVKEKSHTNTLPDGSLQFQGTSVSSSGNTYLDRTTLTPLPDGNVRQVIEISTDNGKEWKQIFSAVYRKNN